MLSNRYTSRFLLFLALLTLWALPTLAQVTRPIPPDTSSLVPGSAAPDPAALRPVHHQPITTHAVPVGTAQAVPAPARVAQTAPLAAVADDVVPPALPEAPAVVASAETGPVGFPDHYAVIANSTLTVSAEAGLLANDLDLDGEALTVIVFDQSTLEGDVTVFADGRLTYTPPEGFTGTDTFRYRMRDASFNQSDYIDVSIEVVDPLAPPLPVELASFDAVVDASAVLLQWETLSETNNAGFEVQRREADTWTMLDFVDGQGTTLTPHQYTYRVGDLQPGTYVFRLRQVDFDGAFEYSPEVEVEVQVTDFALEANYPNPFNPTTTIALALPQATHVEVAVYDLMGRRVAVLVDETLEAGRHEVEWDARDAGGRAVASGTYLYRMDAGSYRQTRRMLLVK